MYEVVIIKRFVLISALAILLILFGGCASQTVTDIDSFIAAFNEISPVKVEKSDICGFAENGEIDHCFMLDETLISLNTDEETMKILSADAVTENKPDENYKNTVRLMLMSLTDISDNDIIDIVTKLIPTNGGFIRTSTETHDYTLTFVSVDAGSKFTVRFNELVPTQTTNIPATRHEYESYSTIPEFTG